MNQLKEIKKNSPEATYLSSRDSRLQATINNVGVLHQNLRSDLFLSLVKSIIGQQLSAKAANTIWNRIEDLSDKICPELFLNLDDGVLRR